MKRKLPKHQTPPGQNNFRPVVTNPNPDVRNNNVLGQFREMMENAASKQKNKDNAARILAEGNESKYDSLGYYTEGKGMTSKDIQDINKKAAELKKKK